MADSTCVKRGGSSFERKEAQVQVAQRAISFVPCVSCGGVIGTLATKDTNELIDTLAKRSGVRV